MFDWLFEGRATVYVLLASAAAFVLVLWAQTHKRAWLYGLAAVALLAGLYFALDRAVETDREQIARKLREIAAAVNARNVEGVLAHVSDHFRSPGGKDKAELRDVARHYINSRRVTRMEIWDVQTDEASRQRGQARTSFEVKAEGDTGQAFYRCESTFDFDPQHGWRLRGFRLFLPQSNEEARVPF